MFEGKPAAVFFDLDGTLADTAPDLGEALNRLLVEHGHPPLDMGSFRRYVSAGTRGMLKVGFGLVPEDDGYADLAQRFLELYANLLCGGTALFQGMPELLDRLDKEGIPWGVVTNKSARFTVPLMEHLGLHRRAAAIVSGDSAAKPKPAPDSLLLACNETGVVPHQALYVGDDLRDVLAARAANMPVIAAAWGYLGDGLPIDEWQADALIESPLDLLDLLVLE